MQAYLKYGKINARRLFYPFHGQGDTRAQPAAAPMANFTFRFAQGKINARRLFYPFHGQGDT
ncbi:hypothetical protein, partial [Anaerotruncus colihominis]|uniref:hypothetical protein n=1 Tax=Anaerotruncus colihominis TaxID=169435 RepID=UPI0026EB0637